MYDPGSITATRRGMLGGVAALGVAAVCGCGGDETSGSPSAGVPATSASGVPATRSSPDVIMLADSLGGPIVAPLAAQLGRSVGNWAIGGQRSTQIANRAVGFTINLRDEQAVAVGSVVTAINGVGLDLAPNDDVSHRILAGIEDNRSVRGTVGGVVGTLYPSPLPEDPTYRFLPDNGQALPRHIADNSGFTPDIPRTTTVIYLAGRNNFFRYDGHVDYGRDRVVQDAQHVITAFDKVLVLAVANGDFPAEYGPDGGLFLEIVAINQDLQTLAGDRYLDHVTIAKDTGLDLARIQSDSRSDQDRAHNVIPYQLRRDALHESSAGALVYASIIASKLRSLNY